MNDSQVENAIALARSIYQYSAVGSNCHIVLDDGNLSDDDIQFCLDSLARNYHEATPDQLEVERKLLNLMMGMSRTQRKKVYRGR